QNISEDLDQIIYHLDEPEPDAAPLHLLHMSIKAKQMGYKVLISGTGGDDVFSGYRRHQALLLERYLKWTPGFALRLMKFLIRPLKVNKPWIRRWKKLFMNNLIHKESRLASYYSILPLKKNKKLFTDSLQQEIAGFDPSVYLKDLLQNIPDEHSDLNH